METLQAGELSLVGGGYSLLPLDWPSAVEWLLEQLHFGQFLIRELPLD